MSDEELELGRTDDDVKADASVLASQEVETKDLPASNGSEENDQHEDEAEDGEDSLGARREDEDEGESEGEGSFADEDDALVKESGKSVYDLESYLDQSILSFAERSSSVTEDFVGKRKILMSTSLGAVGIARINLRPLTQKIVGCVIGENVTTEYPWMYVKKEIIEDNIDLHDESSDFLPVKEEVHDFPGKKILVGYAPSSVEEGQFYICITESARDAIIDNINSLRAEQENRVRNAVYKKIGRWTSLGSGDEVDSTIVRNARPLYEIEVESTADLLNQPMTFTDRGPDDQRDGYLELTPYRQIFENVQSLMVGRAEQATPVMRDNDAQTDPSMPNNLWSQYNYEYPGIKTELYDEEEASLMRNFLGKYTDVICDQVLINATWDVYGNDYENLVRSEKDTRPPISITYTEHQSYSEGTFCKDRVVNDLSWHPFWTGIAAGAYTDHGKSDKLVGPMMHDEVMRACHGNNHVLVWSFSDCLSPKLVLESPREVTAVSFCPFDGNVIIGGCVNGQIAIWNIPGKIEQVEAVVVQTSAQVKYRIAMRGLMSWMQHSISTEMVRPAAMSSLLYSQKSAITAIRWISPYNKVGKNGRIISLPEDTPLQDLTWQFMTSCEDGSVAFWDLKWRPDTVKTASDLSKRKTMVERPEGLVKTISPFKALNQIFKPDYMITIQYSEDLRPVTLTTISIYHPRFRKEEVHSSAAVEGDVTVRRYFQQIPKKSEDCEMKATMLVGSAEGDFMRITWEGYEFSTGMIVNKEYVNCSDYNKIHDGPISTSVRSKYLHNVVLTVGGSVFAIWRDDVVDPVFWRKSKVWYTACDWGSFRPTAILLGRMDGTVEIWDLVMKSEGPNFTQSVSGRIITGIYAHHLPLRPQCIAFCDYNGTLRVFNVPIEMVNFEESDIAWFERFISREVDRVRDFREWQRQWSETNLENIEKKRKLAEIKAERNRIENEEKIKREMEAAAAQIVAMKTKEKVRRPGQFLIEAKERWETMELERMQRVILEKKGLQKHDLEKQRAPVMKLRHDARRKKRKIREILSQQDNIFEDTIALLFPDQLHHRKRMEMKRSTMRENDEEDGLPELADLEKDVEASKIGHSFSIEEEYMYQFLEVQAESLAAIQRNPYKHFFIWRKVLSEGKSRRRVMDSQLRKRSKHRKKYLMQKSGTPMMNVAFLRGTGSEGEEDGAEEDMGEEGGTDYEDEDDETAKYDSVSPGSPKSKME